MSTRANVILKEGKNKLYFYRHSDGYPKGTMPTLEILSKWIKTGKVRKDLTQVSGWLVILGALEYSTIPQIETEKEIILGREYDCPKMDTIQDPTDWKAGAYEPTTGIHGDIEHLYTIDVLTGEIIHEPQ